MNGEFKVGDAVLVGGSRPGVIQAGLHEDPSWKREGYRVAWSPTGSFGSGAGTQEFVPAARITALPTDWTPIIGSSLEERWTWVGYGRNGRMERQVRGGSRS